MKKSTLITTIAMIVVVVVALSTATYAWFTSASQTYATQTISTTAASDITVIVNSAKMLSTETPAVFDTTDLLTQTQAHPTAAATYIPGIRGGLWAPYSSAALANKPSSNSSTDATSSAITKFIAGTQNAAGTQLTVTTAPTDTSADMIRITNNKAIASNIILTIYIAAANTDGARLAAQGVSFYIHDNASFTANTEYSYLDSTVIASGDADVDNNIAITSVADTDEQTHTASFRKVAKSANVTITSGANHRDTETTVGQGFTTYEAGDAAGSAGLTTFYSWYAITIDLGSFNSTASRNFLIYNWLDGQYLTNAAGGAQIGIAYSFAFPQN